MKTVKLLTSVTFLAAALLARADGWERDPLQGFYVKANAGVNIMSDIAFNSGVKLSTQVGERLGASVGYMVPLAKNTGIGLEFELGAIANSLDKISGANGSVDLTGYYYQMPFLVN